MIEAIDHVVLAVEDPEAAAAEVEQKLGLRVSEGGRHEQLGTFNRLVWLGDSYLELIGVFDTTLASDNWLGRAVLASIEAGGGLAAWAVRIEDLDGQLRWTSSDGALTGPIEGERRRSDGRVVRWRLAHPATVSPTAPFLIEHDPTAAEWTRDERQARAVEVHPVGGRVRLVSLDVQTTIPAAAAARIRSLLATTVEPEGRRAVRVAIGLHDLRVVPAGAADAASAVVELVTDVPLRRRVARIGDCEIRLRGTPPRPAILREDGAKG